LLTVTLRLQDVLADVCHPTCSKSIRLRLEPELAIVSSHGEHELFWLGMLSHEALIKVEIERSTALAYPVLRLEVLEDAVLDLHLASLPPSENGRAELL